MNKKQSNDWTKYVTELQQCAAGTRGWVECSKVRAKKLGVAHSNLTVAARSLGLYVKRHGQHGYVASRLR